VVKNVFWRILIFYILSVLIIGLNVPYNYPGLSSKTSSTSPFTIVFQMVGAKATGSFINAVILTSVISAGNHALFAGTRLLYALAVDRHAPQFFGKLNRNRVPWVAVLATSAISGLCFGASFIGAGQLWTWLQNLVGVSNQLAWIAIGVTSIRFRGALERQGKTHLLPFRNWTYPWGPWICVILNIVIVLVQGWSSFSPSFTAVDFVSYYIELPVMAVMWLGWKWLKKTKVVSYEDMDLETDVYVVSPEDEREMAKENSARGRIDAGLCSETGFAKMIVSSLDEELVSNKAAYVVVRCIFDNYLHLMGVQEIGSRTLMLVLRLNSTTIDPMLLLACCQDFYSIAIPATPREFCTRFQQHMTY
jgi:AAT family amino acid transporter